MGGKLPTAVRIARGTQRNDRQGDPELEPQGVALTKMPRVPKGLQEAGKEYWKTTGPQLIEAGLLTGIDLPMFTALCELYDAKSRHEAKVAEVGDYYQTESGDVKQHPAVARLDKTYDRLLAYSKKFGLAPSDRSGMQLSRKRKTGVATRQRA